MEYYFFIDVCENTMMVETENINHINQNSNENLNINEQEKHSILNSTQKSNFILLLKI